MNKSKRTLNSEKASYSYSPNTVCSTLYSQFLSIHAYRPNSSHTIQGTCTCYRSVIPIQQLYCRCSPSPNCQRLGFQKGEAFLIQGKTIYISNPLSFRLKGHPSSFSKASLQLVTAQEELRCTCQTLYMHATKTSLAA